MMKALRTFVAPLALAVVLGAGTAYAQAPACNPGVGAAYAAHAATYNTLINALAPQVATLQAKLAAVTNQATYADLLAASHAIALLVPNGRMVVTLPDGTVAVDTGKPDDAANAVASGNSFQHYQDKTVNENHSSRIAILDAQEWPCGGGIERKFSSTTGVTETYFALRLGAHLDSIGTARISTH